MALNLDDLIMSDDDGIPPMKEPPLFNIAKDIKRNSIEDNNSGSDSSYSEFAKENAKKMSSLIDEIQQAKIEKNERIAKAREQKKKELEEKKKLYPRGKQFNKKENTSNSGVKSSSSKSNNTKTVHSNNVQTFGHDKHNKSSSSFQNHNKSSNRNLKQNKSKTPINNSKTDEKMKTTPDLTSKFNNITIQDFGIESTDSSDYESDNSSNNLSDNEMLKSRAAAKLFTVKNLNESNFYFVDMDSSSDNDDCQKNVKHFQSYTKRIAASKRNKNLNKKRINHNKNSVEKDNITEVQRKIISTVERTSEDKTFENRSRTDQNPSTSKQNVQNQDGKLQNISSNSKFLLQDLFEQTRRKSSEKTMRNSTINHKYDLSNSQTKENKNNLIKNNEENCNKIDKNNGRELDVKMKEQKKKNKKKKELKSTDEVKNAPKSTEGVIKVGVAKEPKSSDSVTKVGVIEETKSSDGIKKGPKPSDDGLQKFEKRKDTKSKNESKKIKESKEQIKKMNKTKEQKWKADEQKEIALSKANSQRIFCKSKFDSDLKFVDDIEILSEIKLNKNKPKIDNSINTVINNDSINTVVKNDDEINIDNLILDSYTSSCYQETINSSNIAGKSNINDSDSESDIDFNTILNETKKRNIATEKKIINISENTVPIIDSKLKFKQDNILNESSSDFEAEFEASLQFNYRNKFK